MKMIFKLSDAQLERAKEQMRETALTYRSVLGNYPLETFNTVSGKAVDGYTDGSGIARHVWYGEVIGYLRISIHNPIFDLSVNVHMKKLVIEGNRNDITNPYIVKVISEIIGKSWRVAKPEIEGDDNTLDLFWWETLEHYCHWRSDWDMYFQWLTAQIPEGETVKQFDARFTEQNKCLSLLRLGKLNEARIIYPKIVEQILPIA